jgi:hypothetical protein
MLSKGVLSFVGRLVGTAAVLASPLAPLVAEAAETPEASSPKTTTVARPSASHLHHHKSAEKRAKKRGTRHTDGNAEASRSVSATSSANTASSHCEDAEVTTERASAKTPPPKPSSTPLPTLAAATTRPLVEPISTKGEIVIELKAHAVEPRRTPIVRALAHTDPAPEGVSRNTDGASRHEKRAKSPCLHTPVNVARGTEEETFPLTKCDGSALPHAVDEMSILVRPGNAAKPEATIAEASAKAPKATPKDDELAPGIKKIDERLVERLQLVLDHFAKPAVTPKVYVVSGYRPSSKGSFHAMGRAIDFRVDGVENTDLVAFCKTLPDTGCGFYPNSSFIHLDIRDSGSGHVSWIDASTPGEKPAYVAAWPLPPNEDDSVKQLAKLDELQLLPPSDHEAKPPETKETKATRSRHADQAQTEQAERAEKVEKAEKTEPTDHVDPAEHDHAEPASLSRKLEDE